MASPISQPYSLGILCIFFILASSGPLFADGRTLFPGRVCDEPCQGYGNCDSSCVQKGFRGGSCIGLVPRVILCCCFKH
ncbi:hypothetical protein AAHE18_04G120000 [Arachis hypogaea]